MVAELLFGLQSLIWLPGLNQDSWLILCICHTFHICLVLATDDFFTGPRGYCRFHSIWNGSANRRAWLRRISTSSVKNVGNRTWIALFKWRIFQQNFGVIRFMYCLWWLILTWLWYWWIELWEKELWVAQTSLWDFLSKRNTHGLWVVVCN